MDKSVTTSKTASSIAAIIASLEGPAWGAPLLQAYQEGPAEVFLAIDLDDGECYIQTRAPHERNSRPAGVRSGATMWLRLEPTIRRDSLEYALPDMVPTIERIVAGTEVYQDANMNWRSRWIDGEAAYLVTELAIPAEYADVREVFEWLNDQSDEELGISADSTDEELKEAAAQIESVAEHDQIVLTGDVLDFLEGRRDIAQADRD